MEPKGLFFGFDFQRKHEHKKTNKLNINITKNGVMCLNIVDKYHFNQEIRITCTTTNIIQTEHRNEKKELNLRLN